MPRKTFDSIGGLAVLGELVRLTAPPAGLGEICDQGLALTVKALAPSRAILLLNGGPDGEPSVFAAWGRRAADRLVAAGQKVIRDGGVYEHSGVGKGGSPVIALPLPGDTGAAGAILNPVILKLTDTSGAGLAGEQVDFTPPPGGSVSPTSTTTDSCSSSLPGQRTGAGISIKCWMSAGWNTPRTSSTAPIVVRWRISHRLVKFS